MLCTTDDEVCKHVCPKEACVHVRSRSGYLSWIALVLLSDVPAGPRAAGSALPSKAVVALERDMDESRAA